MPVERCSRPANEFCRLRRGATLRPFGIDDVELAPNHVRIGWRTTEPGAARASDIDTGLHPFGDEFTLIIRQRPEQPDHKAPGGSGGIDAVDDRPEADVAVCEDVDGLEEVRQRTAKPIESPHDDNVARLSVGEEIPHLGTLHGWPRPGDDIGKDVASLNATVFER